MSKFTGKSDFYDTAFLQYKPEEVLKSDIFTYDGDKISFETVGDLVLYGPYLIGSMGSHKNDDGSYNLNIHLSKESYIDEKEKSELFWYYLTIKNLLLKSKDQLKDINNSKFIQKYNVDLDKYMLIQVYTYIVRNKDFKDLMTAYPIKRMSYNDKYWCIEKMISDTIMSNFHIAYYNNKRLELLEEYGKYTNKLSLKAMSIQRQINEYNKYVNQA